MHKPPLVSIKSAEKTGYKQVRWLDRLLRRLAVGPNPTDLECIRACMGATTGSDQPARFGTTTGKRS